MGVPLALEAPALPIEDALADGGLVDVDDPSSGHHHLDELESESLPLDEGLGGVGPMVDRLGPRVSESQLSSHDVSDLLLVQAWHIGIGNGLADLSTGDYLALTLQELQNSCLDERDLPCPDALFRAQIRYVVFVLVEPAAHAADQGS